MPEIDTTDADLVAAHLAGDRGALAAIYDRYADQLHDTAASMLADRHEAADVTQDVFVMAAERLDQLRDPSRLRAWMFAILRNEVYRRTRRRRRAVPTDFTAPTADMAAEDGTDTSAEAGDAIAAAELGELVRAAARGLDERDQLVLELSARQGLEGADLADALGVSAQQSYGLVHRMRERTERSLAAYCVARAGRKDCDELAAILSGWDGEFTVLIRKRVARHIDRCETCERSRRTVAPLALLRAAPALAAPPELRDRVLGRGRQGGGPTSTTRFRSSDGFPRPPRRRRPPLWLAVAAGVLFVLTAGTTIVATTRPASDAGGGASLEAASATTVASAATTLAPTSPPLAVAPSTTAVGTNTSTTNTTSTTSTSSTTVPPTTTEVAPGPAPAPPAVAPPAAPASPEPNPEPPAVPATPTAPPSPPPTTAAPVTTVPPAPGSLAVSATSLDFGADATSRSVTLSNGGGLPVAWWIDGSPSPFQLSASSGTLAPGEAISVTATIDRAAFPEGSQLAGVASFAAAGIVPRDVAMTATVQRPPVITLLTSPPNPWCVSPSVNQASVTADITDEQSVSATLSWSHPNGQAGSSVMSATGATHAAQFVFVGSDEHAIGTWTWQIVAVDTLGNVATRSGSFLTQLC